MLRVMNEFNVRNIFFSDSIGSFGMDSPREGSSASWLLTNPLQDPGSDYGKQKKMCRDIMADYATRYNFDSRFVVIPGVLHSASEWGIYCKFV